MTFDSTTVENDPFLITMRQELTELEQRKDALYKAADAEPDNARVRLAYDACLMLWARTKVKYEDAIRSVLGL